MKSTACSGATAELRFTAAASTRISAAATSTPGKLRFKKSKRAQASKVIVNNIMSISDRNRALSFDEFTCATKKQTLWSKTDTTIPKYNLQELFDNVPVFDVPLMNFSSAKKTSAAGTKSLESRLTKGICAKKNNARYQHFWQALESTIDPAKDYRYQIGKRFPMQYVKMHPDDYKKVQIKQFRLGYGASQRVARSSSAHSLENPDDLGLKKLFKTPIDFREKKMEFTDKSTKISSSGYD